jgi:hypothetical protein
VPPLEKLWVIVNLPNSNLQRYARCALGVNVDLGAGKTLATDSSPPSQQRKTPFIRQSMKGRCNRPRLQKRKSFINKDLVVTSTTGRAKASQIPTLKILASPADEIRVDKEMMEMLSFTTRRRRSDRRGCRQ